MYCKECGKQIQDDSKFCSYCGKMQSSKIADSIASNLLTKDINQTTSPQEKKEIVNDNHSERNKKLKYDETYNNEYEASIIGGIVITVNIFLLASGIYSNWIETNRDFYAVFSIVNSVWRIFVAVWIYNIAKRQNRVVFSWVLFGLIIPNLALLIIGLLRKKNKEHRKLGENHYSENTSNNVDETSENDFALKMKNLNVRFENDKYVYDRYLFDFPSDAIKYAEFMENRKK